MAVPWCFLVGSKFCKQVWQRCGVLSVLVAGGSPARRVGGLHRRRAPATWRSMSATTRPRCGAGGRAVEAALGLGGRPFQYMNQVHGNDVAGIGAAAAAGAGPDAPASARPPPTADAMVSLGEPLAVMVADCVPIVLVGDRAGGDGPVLAVVHAGRPGVASGVVPAAVARMRELGAAGLGAWIGPSVCGRCYEVPEDMRDDVAAPRSRGLVHHLPRHARPGPAGRRPQPAAGRRRHRRVLRRAAPWKTTTCSPTAATRTPGGSPDWCGPAPVPGRGPAGDWSK